MLRSSPDLSPVDQLRARYRAIEKRHQASIYQSQSELLDLLADPAIDLPADLPEDGEKLDLDLVTYIVDSWCLLEHSINRRRQGEFGDLAEPYGIFREQILPEVLKRRAFN